VALQQPTLLLVVALGVKGEWLIRGEPPQSVALREPQEVMAGLLVVFSTLPFPAQGEAEAAVATLLLLVEAAMVQPLVVAVVAVALVLTDLVPKLVVMAGLALSISMSGNI
jgi:hypothetical protein